MKPGYFTDLNAKLRELNAELLVVESWDDVEKMLDQIAKVERRLIDYPDGLEPNF